MGKISTLRNQCNGV